MWGEYSKIWVRYMIIKLHLKSKFIFLIKSLICLKYRENYTSSNFHGTSMNFYHKRMNSTDHLFQTIGYASKIQNMLPFDSWQYKNKTILLASEIKICTFIILWRIVQLIHLFSDNFKGNIFFSVLINYFIFFLKKTFLFYIENPLPIPFSPRFSPSSHFI